MKEGDTQTQTQTQRTSWRWWTGLSNGEPQPFEAQCVYYIHLNKEVGLFIAEQGGRVSNTDRPEGRVYGVKLDQGDSFS